MVWLVGYVINERFKQSSRSKKRRDYVLDFPGVNDREIASRLVGKKVEYRDNVVRIVGRIVNTHGDRGRLRARFAKTLPGKFWSGRVYLNLDKSILEIAKFEETSFQTA